MCKKVADAFKREVAEFAISSGLSRKQVAADFGVCISSVDRWIKRFGRIPADLTTQNDLVSENKRLRRELQVALQERDILKKATAFFASQK